MEVIKAPVATPINGLLVKNSRILCILSPVAFCKPSLSIECIVKMVSQFAGYPE
jgi:hypothetical protein